MTWRCEDCGSDEIVEEVRQNINTDEIVDSVDDSTTCNDCGSRNLFKEEEKIKYGDMWEELEKLKDKGIVINVAKDFGDSLLLSFSNWEEEE